MYLRLCVCACVYNTHSYTHIVHLCIRIDKYVHKYMALACRSTHRNSACRHAATRRLGTSAGGKE